MILRAFLHRPLGKAILGLAALPSLGGCSQPPEAAPTENPVEDAAIEAKARAKADRDAKLAAFYDGDAGASNEAPANDETARDGPPPAVSAPTPSLAGPVNAPAVPDPGIGTVR